MSQQHTPDISEEPIQFSSPPVVPPKETHDPLEKPNITSLVPDIPPTPVSAQATPTQQSGLNDVSMAAVSSSKLAPQKATCGPITTMLREHFSPKLAQLIMDYALHYELTPHNIPLNQRQYFSRISFLPGLHDQEPLLCIAASQLVQIYNIAGTLLRQIQAYPKYKDVIAHLAALDDSRFAVANGNNGIIKIYNARNGTETGQIEVKKETEDDEIKHLVALPNKRLAIGWDSGAIFVVEYDRLEVPIKCIARTPSLHSLAYLPDNHLVATYAPRKKSRYQRVYNLAQPDKEATVYEPQQSPISCDDLQRATVVDLGTIVWKDRQNEIIHTRRLPNCMAEVRTIITPQIYATTRTVRVNKNDPGRRRYIMHFYNIHSEQELIDNIIEFPEQDSVIDVAVLQNPHAIAILCNRKINEDTETQNIRIVRAHT